MCLIKYGGNFCFSALKFKWKRWGLKRQPCLYLGSSIKCTVHFNIILPSTCSSSKRALPFRFFRPKFCTHFFLSACYMPCSSHPNEYGVVGKETEVSEAHFATIFRVVLMFGWRRNRIELAVWWMMYNYWRGLFNIIRVIKTCGAFNFISGTQQIIVLQSVCI
jgi:hypothetical protein